MGSVILLILVLIILAVVVIVLNSPSHIVQTAEKKVSEGKYDELQKASKDKEYQKRLLAEYGLLNEKQGE